LWCQNIEVKVVRLKTSGNNLYLQIVNNVREGAKVKQHILVALGTTDQLSGTGDIEALIAKLARYADQAMLVLSGQSQLQASTFSIGPALIFERRWKELELPGIIHGLAQKRKFGFDVERAIFLLPTVALRMSSKSNSLNNEPICFQV
jgi:hypothetical protein